jgi:hypothetical protein
MKLISFFMALSMLASLCLNASAVSDYEQRVQNALIANINNTTTTNITVVSAQTNKQIRLYGLLLSTATADTLTVKCGSRNQLGPIYLGATSGVSFMPFYPIRVQCNSNEALIISKGIATTPVSITAVYSQD